VTTSPVMKQFVKRDYIWRAKLIPEPYYKGR
jgi:hypothetical protein